MRWLVLVLLAGCTPSVYVGVPLDGGNTDGAHVAGDLAGGCAVVHCGAHAHCEAGTVACVCDPGYGGDPNAGCSALPACGMCPAHGHCEGDTCACDPGYQLADGQCAVAPLGDPGKRTVADVCAQWRGGHVVADPQPWKAGAMMCDPGTLSRAGIDDTLRRADLFRWLAGLAPVNDDPIWNANDQACAVMEAANGQLNHTPPNTWKCWTQAAYDASSSSNLAFGTGPADAIDLFMDDGGTPSLGHRRWVDNPPLDGVGVGYAMSFTCFHVFGGGNQAPPSPWQALPNPGPVPAQVAGYGIWSFHAAGVSFGNASITVTRKGDGASLPVTVMQLPPGYGVDAVGFARNNWSAQAGETYVVAVAGTSLGNVSYEVSPVNCP